MPVPSSSATPSGPRKPVNLTEAAERAGWFAAKRSTQALSPQDSPLFRIDAVNVTEDGHGGDGLRDEICIIVCGYGALYYRDEVLQCTEGDLLFIPAGAPHRFEHLDGDFRIWRLSPGCEAESGQD